MHRRDLLRMMSAASLLPRPNIFGQTAAKRYEANWDSLDRRPTPSWYTDAKFGIFIHWGVYSVPSYAPVGLKDETAYAEWYWHSLTQGQKSNSAKGDGAHTWQFHKANYGADFPYFDFAPKFRAEFFDPDHWSDVIARSGAKYVALTSKHHEGFTLWKNEHANRAFGRKWNSVEEGPKRDLLIDLMEAGRRKNLQMGIYYSLYEWYNPLWMSDHRRYVTEHLFPQFKEVVEHAKPAIIFSDGEWEIPSSEWRSAELLAWLFNESSVADSVVVDDRWGKDTRHKHGGYYTTEYTSGMQQSAHPWEESRGIGFSYGYNRAETLKDYHSGRQLLLMLMDIVSRGGNLLLDIGPTADGRIPTVMEERLTEIGEWLRPNGEAVYGTTAAQVTRQWSEGRIPKLEDKEFNSAYDISDLVDRPPAGYARVDAFFTKKGNVTYAFLPRWPATELILHDVPGSADTKVSLLETGDALSVKSDGTTMRIDMPAALPLKLPHRDLYTLKITATG